MNPLCYRRPFWLSNFCIGARPALSKSIYLLLSLFVAFQVCAPAARAQSGGNKEATPTWTPHSAAQIEQAGATPTWTVISEAVPQQHAPTPTWTDSAPAATIANLPTAEFTATPLATAAPLPTAVPANVAGSQNAATARLFISEFMANPAAVADSVGEFVEIYNGDTIAVNLRGWILADQGSDSHTIGADLIVAPNAYVVLGRSADTATNGGVQVDYVLSGIQIANGEDELLLFGPDGSEVDRVLWGGSSTLSTTAGASLERSDPADPNTWQTAATAWSGSAGDFGSPGAAYGSVSDLPTPTATLTATAIVTATCRNHGDTYPDGYACDYTDNYADSDGNRSWPSTTSHHHRADGKSRRCF